MFQVQIMILKCRNVPSKAPGHQTVGVYNNSMAFVSFPYTNISSKDQTNTFFLKKKEQQKMIAAKAKNRQELVLKNRKASKLLHKKKIEITGQGGN